MHKLCIEPSASMPVPLSLSVSLECNLHEPLIYMFSVREYAQTMFASLYPPYIDTQHRSHTQMHNEMPVCGGYRQLKMHIRIA